MSDVLYWFMMAAGIFGVIIVCIMLWVIRSVGMLKNQFKDIGDKIDRTDSECSNAHKRISNVTEPFIREKEKTINVFIRETNAAMAENTEKLKPLITNTNRLIRVLDDIDSIRLEIFEVKDEVREKLRRFEKIIEEMNVRIEEETFIERAPGTDRGIND